MSFPLDEFPGMPHLLIIAIVGFINVTGDQFGYFAEQILLRYTGGLSVEKFMKKLTWQKLTPESNRSIGLKAARIARMEGMEGHARASDVRLEKYYPGEKFALHPQ